MPRDGSRLDDPRGAAVDHVSAAEDPLAVLEADYEAVVALSRNAPVVDSSRNGTAMTNDVDSCVNLHGNTDADDNDNDDNDDAAAVTAATLRGEAKAVADGGGGEDRDVTHDMNLDEDSDDSELESAPTYAVLPSSPISSSNEDDEIAFHEDDEGTTTAAIQEEGNNRHLPMDAATKQAIMQSMQGLQLQPPPWAAERTLSDDTLLRLVQEGMSRGVARHKEEEKEEEAV